MYMIHSAKDLSSAQKLAVESLLGRTIAENEQISIQTITPPSSPDRPRRHISEVIADNMRDLPAEVLANLPSDGASEHDHYIYGLPKRHA
jgi:hypothetical protein